MLCQLQPTLRLLEMLLNPVAVPGSKMEVLQLPDTNPQSAACHGCFIRVCITRKYLAPDETLIPCLPCHFSQCKGEQSLQENGSCVLVAFTPVSELKEEHMAGHKDALSNLSSQGEISVNGHYAHHRTS